LSALQAGAQRAAAAELLQRHAPLLLRHPALDHAGGALTFLFFGAHPIRADALAVVAYILPHIGLSTIANSMIGKQYRHSFWASVYEVSIAPFTAGVTLLALIHPRLGRFNVTDKGR